MRRYRKKPAQSSYGIFSLWHLCDAIEIIEIYAGAEFLASRNGNLPILVTATKYSTVKGRGHVTAHLLTGSFLTAELTSASPYGLVLHRRTFLWAQFSLSYLKLQMYNNKWQADRNATYPCASYPRIYFRGRLAGKLKIPDLGRSAESMRGHGVTNIEPVCNVFLDVWL